MSGLVVGALIGLSAILLAEWGEHLDRRDRKAIVAEYLERCRVERDDR